MPILNTIFEKSLSDNLTKSLGNIIISGVENEGYKTLYFNMLSEMLKAKKTVILANGSLSNDTHRVINNYLRPHLIGRRVYDFNYTGTSSTVDILSAFNSVDKKADFIVVMLSALSDIPELLKSKAQRFYTYAMTALELLRKPYTLKDLIMMDIDYVVDLVNSSPMSDLEKNRCLRFLSDTSMYSSFLDIETGLVKLESSGLCNILSGSDKMIDVISDGNVIMLSGLLSDDFRKKELLFNLLFYALGKSLETFKSASKVNFLIKDADFVAGDHIKQSLEYNISYDYATYIFIDDISRYISKNGNEILDMTKSFLVFNQGSDDNASFWSAFFGSRDVQEKSFSYTKKKSWNPFSNMWDNGGVVSTPRNYNTATQSFQKVNKPIYRPEVFRELRSKEVMCYLREPLMRRKTNIEE